MRKGATSIRFAGDFLAVVSCWIADHWLGSTHVKDVLSAGFEVKPRSERTLVIQHKGSATKAWFPHLLFAHGPKPPPSAVSSYNLPEAAPVLGYAQSPHSAKQRNISLRLSSFGKTLQRMLCLPEYMLA